MMELKERNFIKKFTTMISFPSTRKDAITLNIKAHKLNLEFF